MISRTGALALAVSLIASAAVLSPALAQAENEAVEPEILLDWLVIDDVGSEFQIAATVHNRTASTHEQWSIEVPFRHAITQIAGAVSVQDESTVTISGTQPLLPGDEQLVEMSVTSAGPVSRIPGTCVVAETACRVVVPGVLATDVAPGGAVGEDSPSDSRPDAATAPTGPSATPDSDSAEQAEASVEESPTTTDSPGDPSIQSDPDSPNRQPDANQGGDAESPPPQHQKLVIAVATTNDWGIGQSVNVTVRNDGPSTINEWSVSIPWEIAVASMWNAKSTSGGNKVRAGSEAWNGQLEPGQAIQFGINGSPGASSAPDGSCTAETDLGPADCSLSR